MMYPSVTEIKNKQKNNKSNNFFKTASQYIFNDYLKTGNKHQQKTIFMELQRKYQKIIYCILICLFNI